MRKIIQSAICLVLIITSGFVFLACGNNTNKPGEMKNKGEWTVLSPNGSLKTQVIMDNSGKLSYTVLKDDIAVVKTSRLGFDIEEDDFSLVTLEGAKTKNIKGSYQNMSGKSRNVEFDGNELTITLKGWKYYLDVIIRTYDEGYAFRYGIRAIDGSESHITVINELSEFAIPEGATVWAQPYKSISPDKGEFFAYEETYTRRQSGSLADQQISMPLLYQVKGQDIYSLITESELIGSGFYGSFLEEQEGKSGTGILQTVHTPARAAWPDNVIASPFTSPWRLSIIGSLGEVVESELVEKLYDDTEYWKPDNYETLSAEEKKTFDYDWVDTGVSSWSWLVYHKTKSQGDYSLHMDYLDLAYEMGWNYITLDAGWDENINETSFKQFVRYANSRNIKVLVWANALVDFGNGNYNVLVHKLNTWQDYGIEGIKIDFFDGQNAYNPSHQGEDIETIKWYEQVYQETAKRKMIVNCHGANKPTGERRKYPHVLTREAIHGNEMTSVDSSITVNSMFVRAVVGPSDFTPVVNPFGKGLTVAHQMALAVLYESGLQTMADYTAAYKNDIIKDFYQSIPSAREATVFVGGELDVYYSGAIKAGEDWYVAGINSILQSDITIDFDFLDDGASYEAQLFTDNSQGFVTRTNQTITKNDTQTLTVGRNGGFVYKLVKKA